MLKNETLNPTWSWKDRPACISLSMAKQLGFARVAAISTGNHGSSTAAYAAAAGLACVILCHPDVSILQCALMTAYGARVVRGGNQEALLKNLLDREGYFPCTILCPRPGYSNPYGIEGFKTIAFEIYEQFGRAVPSRIFVPVGSGDGIYGIAKGFRELHALGLIDGVPRLIGCQASGADSAYRASARQPRAEPLSSVSTLALSVGERVTGDHALSAVWESAGEMVVASDEETLEAAQDLARQGLAVELASALAFACAPSVLERRKRRGDLARPWHRRSGQMARDLHAGVPGAARARTRLRRSPRRSLCRNDSA